MISLWYGPNPKTAKRFNDQTESQAYLYKVLLKMLLEVNRVPKNFMQIKKINYKLLSSENQVTVKTFLTRNRNIHTIRKSIPYSQALRIG